MLSKDYLYDRGILLVKEFLSYNNINIPNYNKLKYAPRDGSCGYYVNGSNNIFIHVESCARVNAMYSFPGLFCDRTPYGVLCHETGHYVDEYLGKISKGMSTKEKPLTSYCPNKSEYFAEMFRLFVTNPDLLRRIRPNSYKYISKYLKKVVNNNYLAQLELFDAYPKVIERAQNKILESFK